MIIVLICGQIFPAIPIPPKGVVMILEPQEREHFIRFLEIYLGKITPGKPEKTPELKAEGARKEK